METLSVVETNPLPVPESRWERALYALIVVALPIICFSLSDILKPEWQTGKFSDYTTLMLLPGVSIFFFPFLLYAMVCMALILIVPERFAPSFIVRFGVYTGTLLALQYAILTAGTDFIIVSTVSAVVLILGKWLLGKLKSTFVAIGIVLLLFILTGIGLLIWRQIDFPQLLFLALIAFLSASPFLCLAIAAVTTVKLIRLYETKSFTFVRGASLLTWLASYGFAWRFSILKAIEVYHSLPPQPPDCYIATAAARGHKSLVLAQPVALPTDLLWVNPQLQTLKCAELVLMALLPGLHRPLRKMYDLIGKELARRLTNPYLADLAYLSLKPVEWLVRWVMKAFIPEIDQVARNLYRGN